MKLHLQALMITIYILCSYVAVLMFAEYYPRQTLKVMLVITLIGFPVMVYYLIYKALKSKENEQRI